MTEPSNTPYPVNEGPRPLPAPPEVPAGVAQIPAPPAPVRAPSNIPSNPRPQFWGRRYSFLCSYCSSRLEAVQSMAGQSGNCPTCGNAIVIPLLDNRNRLIDPTSGKIIKQDPHPVHAYAAAGHKAPLIDTNANGDRLIRCPRCDRQNPLAANNCLSCGLPFTMEGTAGDSMAGNNTWAVASLVLGIVSIVGGCILVMPPVLALVFGFIALRGANSPSGKASGQGLAIVGIVLGTIGMVLAGLIFSGALH